MKNGCIATTRSGNRDLPEVSGNGVRPHQADRRFSQNWVFPYWWEFSRFYRRETGLYVPDDEMVRLSLVPFAERRAANVTNDFGALERLS